MFYFTFRRSLVSFVLLDLHSSLMLTAFGLSVAPLQEQRARGVQGSRLCQALHLAFLFF